MNSKVFSLSQVFALSLVMAAMVSATMISDVVFADEIAPSRNKEIRELLHRLSISEREADDAASKLKTLPRADVLAVLKDDLTNGTEGTEDSLKGALALDAREVLPELKALALRAESWRVFTTASRLLKLDRSQVDSFMKIYEDRLHNLLSLPAKGAVLEGLVQFGKPIKSDLFRYLFSSKDPNLRLAVVQHFLQTRATLSENEQRARFNVALRSRPFSARLAAMEELSRMPASERLRFRGIFDERLCRAEKNREVLSVCRSLEKNFARGAGP